MSKDNMYNKEDSCSIEQQIFNLKYQLSILRSKKINKDVALGIAIDKVGESLEDQKQGNPYKVENTVGYGVKEYTLAEITEIAKFIKGLTPTLIANCIGEKMGGTDE